MSTSLEQTIVKLLQDGDKAAINLLYENYSDSLYGVILKVTNNEAIAQDALQESFVKIWKHSKKYDAKKAKLFTWLYRIAKNTAIDKLRSFNNRFEKEVQIDKSNVYILPTQSLNQDVLDLRNHVERLDSKYQIVLNALFFEGLTQQEASEELDIPLGTIKSRLKIGLRELKKSTIHKTSHKMEKKLQSLFNSGLMDKYILGDTSIAENVEVEYYISEYPEVEREYNRLQNNLEIISKSNAISPPKHVLDSILEAIEDKPVISMSKPNQKMHWFSFAASFAAVAFAVMSFFIYQKNMVLIEENQVVVDEIFDLRSDIEDNNSKLDHVMLQFMKLNNPETEKYILRGNSRAKDLKTVAYINQIDKTSMIDVVSLPKLPEEQQYQIWAELQDKMVSLGILDANDRHLKSIPYMENALGLSITIENKNNASNNASAENAVAEISLKNK